MHDDHFHPEGNQNLQMPPQGPVTPGTKPGLFEVINSKTAFWMGTWSALAAVFVVAFFVLLGANVKGYTIAKKSDTTVVAVAGAPTAPVATKEYPLPEPPAEPTTPANIQVQPVSDKDHVRGNKNAKVTLVEFSDTECPFCKRFHPEVKQVMATYGDKVNWVYRHFPLDSLHPKARKEAEATECAAELGGNDAFWKYLDRIYEVTPANNGLDVAELPKIAKFIGLNEAKFNDCLKSGKHATTVQNHSDQAIAAGGQGTPYSIILAGNEKIPVNGAVPYDQLKSILDTLVK